MGRFSLFRLPLRGLLGAATGQGQPGPGTSRGLLGALLSSERHVQGHQFVTRVFSSHATFQPSRLYPKQRYKTAEDAAFWGIAGLNVGMLFAAGSGDPYTQHLIQRHFVTSLSAIYDGRLYTVFTSVFTHTSAFHCFMSLALFAFFRRIPHTLSAAQLLKLYIGGGVAGNLSHLAYYWYDARGYKYGAEYAANTPGMMGASGAVSAVLMYKARFSPHAVQRLFILPIPLLLAELLFINIHVRERDFQDGPPPKMGGAVLGLLLASAQVAKRRPPGAAAAAALRPSAGAAAAAPRPPAATPAPKV